MSAGGTGTDVFVAGTLRWLNEHAAHGLFTTDRDLRIRTWNKWLENATGLAAGDAVGQLLIDVIPTMVDRGVDHYYRDALTGQAKFLSHTLHRYLLPCVQEDGTMMRQTARIQPLLDGEDIVGTITLVNDVSDRVAAEQQLRAQIAVAEEARLQAEAASRAKDEFLATLSHEIRTPLSAVLGWVHLLKVREPDAVTIKRAVEVGFGLAIVPEPAVTEAKKAGTLAVIQLAEKYWTRSVGVIYRSDRNLSLAAKKFVQLLEV